VDGVAGAEERRKLGQTRNARRFALVEDSGYSLAKLSFEIVFAPTAVAAYRRLPARVRASVRDALETHLRHEPTKVSKSRIKRLRGLSRPQYRLRVDHVRVFYDVSDGRVDVLAIVTKAQAESWLAQEGIPNEDRGSSKG
jgi:mRNA-degrading endonuclease RelE of RelBE toxin-antitoxin system